MAASRCRTASPTGSPLWVLRETGVNDREGGVDPLQELEMPVGREERTDLCEEALRVKREPGGHRGNAPHRVLTDRQKRPCGTRGIAPIPNEPRAQFAKELSTDLVQ